MWIIWFRWLCQWVMQGEHYLKELPAYSLSLAHIWLTIFLVTVGLRAGSYLKWMCCRLYHHLMFSIPSPLLAKLSSFQQPKLNLSTRNVLFMYNYFLSYWNFSHSCTDLYSCTSVLNLPFSLHCIKYIFKL